MKIQETQHEITLEPAAAATAAVIWLHGLGADGHDFVPITGELGLAANHSIRFIFPHAPVRPVTINNGMQMRAWYDILSLSKVSASAQDSAGIHDSEIRVHRYIQQQLEAGIKADKIVIAGFSQGGAIALHTSLRYPHQLAGVLALSTYLPLHENLAAESHAANRATPILMCHGTFDPVLPYALGEFSCKQLQDAGYAVDWHSYPMQHQVCLEEIEQIGRWLTHRLC